MNNHPHLSTLYTLYKNEAQPFRKVHRLIDLFESIIKMHTVVIVAEYFKRNKLSDSAKGLLAQGMRTPSLGTWHLFSCVLFEELQQDRYNWLLPHFALDFSFLYKSLQKPKTDIINFRNSYAHGATPSDGQCEGDILKFEPLLNKFLQLSWLQESAIKELNGRVFIKAPAGELSLHPILLYRKEENEVSYAFFNDLKMDKVGLLNYPLSKHYREKEFWNEFHAYFPLQEWKKAGNNKFYQRIEELTETFKGRTEERAKLLHFVLNNQKGYFSIQGNPGIGKSALIAQFFKDLKQHKEAGDVQVVEYFIRRGTAQAQADYLFNYLIKKTDELFSAGKEIRAEGKAIWDLQQQLFSKWRMWSEQNNGKKLLFLIDGLDEGVENNVVTYLPRENFEHILVIYGSRPGGHKSIDDLWTQLPPQHHAKQELKGLNVEDIRALIYEVANKYEIDRESAWIDAVQLRSQGNPLYLKLLCDAIEHGSIALNDIKALPKEIDEYYKAILSRYANDPVDGDALLNGLYAFAAAKDYLTMAHLGLINQLGEASIQRIGSTLKEVLYENPLTEDVLDYQLFHESFREYLVKEKAKQVTDAAERIIDFCAGWKELEGSWEQRYALENYAKHLSESKKTERHEQLIRLLYDQEYTTTQKKVLRGFDASNELYRLSLLKSSELDRFEDILESALSLVDLKYEEANDAPKIVEMVANGEIELALKRIESFGGADEEGIKRKFILYMLCLMELTLLDSKDKPFRKSVIEKLLKHLDEQIPLDTSIINWNNFFPSYIIYLMACEWGKLDLDYLIVYKRTEFWEYEWLLDKGPYTDLAFEVILACARLTSNLWEKSFVLLTISGELYKQGKIDESKNVMHSAIECAREINDTCRKNEVLKTISRELAKHGKIDEALEFSSEISDDKEKAIALQAIAEQLAKQGKIENSLECAREISHDEIKSFALQVISGELAKQGNIKVSESAMQLALDTIQRISNDCDKDSALLTFSVGLVKQNKVEEAFECAYWIIDNFTRSKALVTISEELYKQGNIQKSEFTIQEAIECVQEIFLNWQKYDALHVIVKELAKQGKFKKAFECARQITNYRDNNYVLRTIVEEMAKQGKFEEAFECARVINYPFHKDRALNIISGELAKQGNFKEAAIAMELSNKVSCFRYWDSDNALNGISIVLARQDKMEEANECVCGIKDEWVKIYALLTISGVMAKQGKIEKATSVMQNVQKFSKEMSGDWEIDYARYEISSELAEQGRIEEAFEWARAINRYFEVDLALQAISRGLVKKDKIEEAFECAREITYDFNYSQALQIISGELAKKGKIKESESAMQLALDSIQRICNDYDKNSALLTISVELVKQNKVEEALDCAYLINDFFTLSQALVTISEGFYRNGQSKEAAIKMQEALVCARELSILGPYWQYIDALTTISNELVNQDNWGLAEKIGFEIPKISDRHNCWKSFAKNYSSKDGWFNSIHHYHKLQINEARLFYLKGWSEAVSVQEVDSSCLQETLSLLAYDTDSIENLLTKYALHELFWDKNNNEQINRLNKTLNIQWAIDIYAKFPSSIQKERHTSNIEEWIHEVCDKDDKDDILGWAEKVKSGKMTEEKFQKKLKSKLID